MRDQTRKLPRTLIVVTTAIVVLALMSLGCGSDSSSESILNSSAHMSVIAEETDGNQTGYRWDTVFVYDTTVVVDTVAPVLEGKWLEFGAYLATIDFVKQNFPEFAADRFSSMTPFCDYTVNTPAGRAGFRFIDEGDNVYYTRGYIFRYLYGAIGFVWGSSGPTEATYYYDCHLKLESDNTFTLLELSVNRSGDYIRDTRHD